MALLVHHAAPCSRCATQHPLATRHAAKARFPQQIKIYQTVDRVHLRELAVFELPNLAGFDGAVIY
jgi:hypothetical protein